MKTDARGNLHDTNGRFAGKPRGDDSDLDSPATDSLSLAHDRLAILLWRTAKVEVPALTLPDTEEILKGMTPKTDKEIEDFSVVVNLKRAWQYLFEHATDWLDWQYVSEYNRLLGQGIVENAGGLRTVGVHVGDYRPPFPRLDTVAGQIAAALSEHEPVRKAIRIYGTIARGQWFHDGNKRTAAMTANHSLIHDDAGLFALPPDRMGEYSRQLIDYYHSGDLRPFAEWLEYHAIIDPTTGLTQAQEMGDDPVNRS